MVGSHTYRFIIEERSSIGIYVLSSARFKIVPSSRFTFNFIFGQFQLVVVGEQRDTCNLERKLFVDFCDYDAHRWWRATRNSKLIAALIADGCPTV